MNDPLTAVFHNDDGLRFAKILPITTAAADTPTLSASELLAMMRKAMAAMGPPGVLAERVDMGKNALAELRRLAPSAPAPADPLGLNGVRILLSDTLDDDQWIAYDHHGIPLAVGRAGAVKILAAAPPSPSPSPAPRAAEPPEHSPPS